MFTLTRASWQVSVFFWFPKFSIVFYFPFVANRRGLVWHQSHTDSETLDWAAFLRLLDTRQWTGTSIRGKGSRGKGKMKQKVKIKYKNKNRRQKFDHLIRSDIQIHCDLHLLLQNLPPSASLNNILPQIQSLESQPLERHHSSFQIALVIQILEVPAFWSSS